MSTSRRARGGVLWNLAQSVGTRALSTVVFVVLARLLTPTDLGLVALAAVFIALLGAVADQGLGAALVQRDDVTRRELDTAFWCSAVTGTLLCLALVVLAAPIAGVLDEPRLAPLLAVLAFDFVLTGLRSTPQALLTRAFDFRRLAMRRLAGVGAGGVVGIVVAASGGGAWSLVAQTLVGSAVATVAVWRSARWWPGRDVSRTELRSLLRFGSAVTGSEVVNFANRRADDLVIGAVLGPAALGLYAVAYKILLLITEVLIRTFDAVAYPTLSSLRDDPDRRAAAYYRMSECCAAVALPAFTGLAVLAPAVIELSFGPRWTGAVPVMRMLCAIGALHGCLFLGASLTRAAGRPGLELGTTAANAAANVVAIVVAVRWGITGVAAAYVVRGYLLAPLSLRMAASAGGVRVAELGRRIVRPAVASAVMAGAMLGLLQLLGPSATALQQATIIVPAAGVYLVALWLVDPPLATWLRAQLAEVAADRSRARQRRDRVQPVDLGEQRRPQPVDGHAETRA